MKIKKAEQKHLESILSIQEKCYPEDMIECPAVFESIIEAGESYILVLDDIIVGYALCHFWHDIDRPPRLHEELDTVKQHACFFIHDLAIDPNFRGMKLASAFVNFIRNVVEIPITLVSVNDTFSFWHKFGFIQAHCDSRILDSFSRSAIYMLLL